MTIAEVVPNEIRPVMVVDLDGTLTNTDTLYEQMARLIFRHTSALPGAFGALLRGKAAFKSYHAESIPLAVDTLNYQAELIDFLRAEKAKGTHVVLCTAADMRIAKAVSAYHTGLFDEVLATENGTNLKGVAKAQLLKERFPDGFVYAGDSSADLAVWREADGIILVGVQDRTEQRAKALGKPIVAEFKHGAMVAGNRLRIWARALRVHHWSKNILMFVPLILAHAWFDTVAISNTAIGFLLLLAVTSSSYLINDLSDLDADRRHPTKRTRPLARGAISIQKGLATALVTIPVALALAFLLEPTFGMALVGYLVLTLGYSFGLKRIPLLDTFIIGTLFTSRIVMGGALLGAMLSEWLLTFSMFFFFSLATAKRHVEVMRIDNDIDGQLNGRGYLASDAPLTLAFGVASGIASILILVLYLTDEAFRTVGYARPEALWLVVMAVAIWMGRIWILTHRGQMLDDPVSFALRDRVSVALGALVALAFMVAV